MEIFGTQGLFLFCTGVALTAEGLIIWRIRQRQAPPLEGQVEFHVMPRTSPIIGEMDPRAEPVDQQEPV